MSPDTPVGSPGRFPATRRSVLLVAHLQGKYYLEIILPGSVFGTVVGYSTQRIAGRRQAAALTESPFIPLKELKEKE